MRREPRFIGTVSRDENTYFLRAFEALGVNEDRRGADPDTQASTGFKAIMHQAAETRSYAAVLSVLVVTEWLYFDWASPAPKPPPHNFVHAEWIPLRVTGLEIVCGRRIQTHSYCVVGDKSCWQRRHRHRADHVAALDDLHYRYWRSVCAGGG